MMVMFRQFELLPVPRHLVHANPRNIRAPMFAAIEDIIFISCPWILNQHAAIPSPQCSLSGRNKYTNPAKFYAP